MPFMRQRRFLLAAVLGCWFAFAPGSAGADENSLSDYLGPREVSVGESMRGAATGARAITLNPAGLSLARQLVFEGSYGFRGQDNASSLTVSACDSTNAVPGCYYYRYFTAKPTVGSTSFHRRAHEAGIALSRALGPRLSIGTTTKYFDYNSDLTGEEDAAGFAFDAGLMFSLSRSVSLGLVGHNIVAENSTQYPRAAAVGLSLRPVDGLSFSGDAVWNLDTESSGRYGGGAEYFYRSDSKTAGYPVRLGGVYDSSNDAAWATGGLGYTNPKIGVDIGARKQVQGGDELLVLGGLRFFSNSL